MALVLKQKFHRGGGGSVLINLQCENRLPEKAGFHDHEIEIDRHTHTHTHTHTLEQHTCRLCL